MRIDYEIPDNINLMGFASPEDNTFGDNSSHSEDELSEQLTILNNESIKINNLENSAEKKNSPSGK
jgi:hypothetical protein